MAEQPNMTFKDLYQQEKDKPTPALQFIKDIAKLTCSSEITVRLWLSGNTAPDALAKKTISEHFNIPVETLFPTAKNSNQ